MATRLFSDTLNMLRFGTLNEDLGRELAGLVIACESAGKAGTLTLKLTVKPGAAGQLEIADDIAVKKPKEVKGSSLLFSTPEGNLQRQDPRQMEIEGIRQVGGQAPASAETVRHVSTDATTAFVRSVNG